MNLGVVSVIAGTILSAVVFTVAEIFVLKLIKFGEASKQIYYAISANVASVLSIGLGVLLLIAFMGIGLIVAMDKGYNSGEKYITIATISVILIPLFIFLARGGLFLIFKLGSSLVAVGYSLATTVASLILLTIIVVGLLAITS